MESEPEIGRPREAWSGEFHPCIAGAQPRQGEFSASSFWPIERWTPNLPPGQPQTKHGHARTRE